ncbi:MAG: glutathione S-transferase [Pyrobaculum sp.]
MTFQEFIDWATGQTTIFSAQLPYFLTTLDTSVLYIKDLDLLSTWQKDGDALMLGFLDLRKRVLVEVGQCDDVETITEEYAEIKDVPWPGYSTKFAFAIYPVQCEEGRAAGFITLKINTTVDKAYFNWGKIASFMIREYVEEYLQVLNKKYRVIDAVDVVPY